MKTPSVCPKNRALDNLESNITMYLSGNLRPHAIVFLAFCCLLALSSTAPGQDRVYPKKGPIARGKISEITRDEVTIEGSSKMKIPVAEIQKIVFEDEPPALDRVRQMVQQEQYDQAIDELKKLDPKSAKSPYISQDMEFYYYFSDGKLALAGRGGNKEKAIAGLLALAKKNNKSHHMYEISMMLGDLSSAIGKPDALNYYKLLLSSPDPEVKIIGEYRIAQLELNQGKRAEARSRFQQVAKTTADSPEIVRIKNLAEVGLAMCDVQDGKGKEALDQIKQLAQKFDNTDQELFAKLCNAKGACHLALNEKQLALLAYLQTDLLFSTDAESHAEALYQLSQLWPQAGDPSRGSEARARLIAKYASSPWANK